MKSRLTDAELSVGLLPLGLILSSSNSTWCNFVLSTTSLSTNHFVSFPLGLISNQGCMQRGGGGGESKHFLCKFVQNHKENAKGILFLG